MFGFKEKQGEFYNLNNQEKTKGPEYLNAKKAIEEAIERYRADK